MLCTLTASCCLLTDEKEEMQTDVASETISHRSLFNSLLQDVPLTNDLDGTVAK